MAVFNVPGLSDFIAPRRNALLGFASGLARGPDLSQGLAYGFDGAMQGRQQDDAYATAQKAEAERQRQISDAAALKDKYASFFMEQNRPDIAQGIADGIVEPGAAYLDFIKPPAVDPFTLGPGQVRYGADGKPIAQGPAQSPENIFNIGGTDKFYDSLDAKLADQTAGLIDSGRNARTNNAKLTQLETLLQTAPQGAQGQLTLAAGELGIPLDGMNEAQAAQALINQLVPEQRPPGTGPMSDADLALFKQSVPRIINQPGGNQIILQTMKAINEYTIAQADIAAMVANREISPAEGRKRQASIPNPLSNINAAITAKPTSGGAGGGTYTVLGVE
jgi:hypothetical protein